MWVYPHTFPQKSQPYPQFVDKACFIVLLFIYFLRVIYLRNAKNRVEMIGY